ncbi:3'(2'),5'-bisphosphate nucleotidase CysQ [Lewinella cohaerens]|uniref:3'(2'),5'-bisphosphate nucleotidase CysQ n=1 Tax=Lewinella cohaerens TaxID=70995 RepID=UPI00037C2C0F|nr:3'(2'),5'-bisphosphate nucleotidase CysQ [Lewinella cohaerens]
MTIDFSKLADEVGTIARAAGAAILEVYADNDNFGIEHKADNSPLTRADQAANAVIMAGLEQLDFQAPIVSEENKEVPYSVRKDFDYFWLVDPLDGTKEFIKRNGEFTVNIALVQAGRVVFGVVYVPVTAELYWAAKGYGAFAVAGANEARITAASFTMADTGLKVVASRSHLNEGTQAFVDALEVPELVSKGSSLKLLLVASGAAHLYPRLAPTMEWDTAAAQIIAEEAGGKVVQAETGEPVVYNKENLLNPHFIVYGQVRD